MIASIGLKLAGHKILAQSGIVEFMATTPIIQTNAKTTNQGTPTMQNNLTPADVVIVPNLPNMTDEQAEAIAKVADCCGGIASSIYGAATKSTPPHNLIAVDKGEWERLREAAKAVTSHFNLDRYPDRTCGEWVNKLLNKTIALSKALETTNADR